MIAMMYIVLTALLALNVSKSMLDAFLVVNESMETTNKNFQEKLMTHIIILKNNLILIKLKLNHFGIKLSWLDNIPTI